MVEYKLVEPCTELEKEFIKLVLDYRRNGIKDYPKYFKEDFSQYLDTLKKFKEGIDLPEGYLTTETYWLINTGNEILGTIRYREHLNE